MPGFLSLEKRIPTKWFLLKKKWWEVLKQGNMQGINLENICNAIYIYTVQLVDSRLKLYTVHLVVY